MQYTNAKGQPRYIPDTIACIAYIGIGIVYGFFIIITVAVGHAVYGWPSTALLTVPASGFLLVLPMVYWMISKRTESRFKAPGPENCARRG